MTNISLLSNFSTWQTIENSELKPKVPDNSRTGGSYTNDVADIQFPETLWIDGEGSSSLRSLEKNQVFEETIVPSVRSAAYAGTGVFDIYVETGLLSSIEIALNTYVTDLTNEGYQVTVQEFLGGASELRTQLQSRWQRNGLEGALLVGDLPYLSFTSEDNFSSSGVQVTYPHDLYFMDLNGNYDLAPVGLDQHTGDVGPEVYVSRLTTSNLFGVTGQDEANLINDYFAKNHAYRTGQLTFEDRGIVFADDDWRTWGAEQMQDLYSEVLAINDLSETTKDNYLNILGLNYESILEAIHSSSTGHAIKVGSSSEWISNFEISATNPRVGFYNLFNCSSANFTVPNNLIGAYVYSGDYGLNAVGSTKTGSMLGFPDYYRPQGNGDSVGQAFLQWFDQYAASTDDPAQDWRVDWFYGMTMQGDPTLKPTLQVELPVEIRGTKWNDLNGDGIIQAIEPGLAGWTIYLDQNQNNQLDEGEAFTVTDARGSYKFSDLAPGTYTVAEVPQAGWAPTHPTRFDYDWSDSDRTDLPFNWIDISAVGTEVSLSDDTHVTVPLPFDFSFYGEVQETVNISSNGYLTLGDEGWRYMNDPIPESVSPNNLIAPFWDDLNPEEGGNIYHYHDAENDQFIVQYDAVPHYYDEGAYTFEVILNADGSILYQYDDLNGYLNSATIGVENADGSDGVQIAYNESYVHNDLAILLEPVPNRSKPYTVLVGSGETVLDIDFGNQQLPPELAIGLYDSDRDILITMLEDGAEIAKSTIVGKNLTIAAFVPEDMPLFGQVESMFLNLNEGQVTQLENVEPYALFGDTKGNFKGGHIPLGDNTISFDLYSRDGRRGDFLGTVTRSFSIVDDLDLDIGLYDADTDELITMLEEGDEILASAIPNRNVNIAAFVPDDSFLLGQVESLFLDLNNGQVTRIENVEPYALFGDTNGDFRGGSISIGDQTIAFDLYSQDGLRGDLLGTVTRNFEIVA